MHFATIYALGAASAVLATAGPPPEVESVSCDAEESTITLTATMTETNTITVYSGGENSGYLDEPTPEEVPAVPTSEIVIVESSSPIASYPIGNSTSAGVGPTAVYPPSSALAFETSAVAAPTEDGQTGAYGPSSPPAEEPSEPSTAGADGVVAQGGLLVGMLAVAVGALL